MCNQNRHKLKGAKKIFFSFFFSLIYYIIRKRKSTVSRGHATFLLFAKAYTREVEVECLKMIDDNTINMQICHGGDQLRPVLVPSSYLNQHADSDIISFLNAVFTPSSPSKDDNRNFSYENLSTEEIFKKNKEIYGTLQRGRLCKRLHQFDQTA